ncbi:sigma-E processing peptidase SpoIIGA [Anaerofustis sp.]|uniref:sigma-E processing peptidase SpoIIGA n=1 Tax=Anaerofustis sp. TaxID=1872517 RepID=UPI0025C05769|nr:sigma-E processing peptidase SpoIIGA [Anaerofustis sp.]
MFNKRNIFTGIFTALGAYILFRKLNNIMFKLYYSCTLYSKERNISFVGYLDTGNFIKSINGEDVIIVHSKIINEILNTNLSFTLEDYNDYLFIYNNLPLSVRNDLTYTFYTTTDKKNILPILRFDKIILENNKYKKIIYNPCIGILDIDLSEALLPVSIIK